MVRVHGLRCTSAGLPGAETTAPKGASMGASGTRRSRGRWVLVIAAVALVGGALASCSDDSADGTTTTAPDVVAADEGTYRAEIVRTTDGVPHITATDLPSVVFGQGWASGEDHACTLADQILKITSTRAKWLGAGDDNVNLNSDFAWKALRLQELAAQEWETTDSDVVELITAFTDGWNAQLEEVGADGISGWCSGADWLRPIEPVELYAYAKSILLTASGAQLARYMGNVQPPGAADSAAPSATPARLEVPAQAGSSQGGSSSEAGASVASNAWAFGSERTEGGGMLMANPHFPWEGGLRFWEVQLTVPGELDVYGAQLTGLPAVGIGFNEDVAWSHTVSDGNRFTAYKLSMAPGDPTAYVKDGATKELTSEDVTVEVAGAEPVTRTLWWSEYGPMLDFPGMGWTTESALTYRDANITNDEFLDQYLDMNQAGSMEELKKAHEEHQAIPLFNTIATSADGQAWYADTSATPNLSPEAIAAFEERLESDPITATANKSKAILLDGSTSRDDWVEVDGARDPGLVPYSEMPQITRDDYVFNANDSFWLANGDELIEGDYSILHGRQDTQRSRRTLENLAVLEDVDASGPMGDDEQFDLDELTDAALRNGGYMSRQILSDVVERCTGAPPVQVPEVPGTEGTVTLPAATVDVTEACQVLADWDGLYDVESSGAALFREFLGQFPEDTIWAEPFDPQRPLETPAGLVAAPADGGADPVLQALARATQMLTAAGIELSAPLGEVQVDGRGSKLPVPGGSNAEGATNIVSWSQGLNDGARAEGAPARPGTVNKVTGLTPEGWWINNGTSFLMVVEFTEDGPEARTILTYGETADRDDPRFTSQVERFAAKDWKIAAFRPEQVKAEATGETYEVSGPRG